MDGEINGAKLELSLLFVLRLRLSQHYAGGFRHLLTDRVIYVEKVGGLQRAGGKGKMTTIPTPSIPKIPFITTQFPPCLTPSQQGLLNL